MTLPHPYRGRWATLATQHAKGRLIAPVFDEVLGLEVTEANVDTDGLGTFTGEIERTASPFDTAVTKARLGIEATRARLGLASEGSIGPVAGMAGVIADTELVVMVDEIHDQIVGESYTGYDLVAVRRELTPSDPLHELVVRADLPRHHLIVRTPGTSGPPPDKGISDLEHLRAAIARHWSDNGHRSVVVETDLRAHRCPSRRRNIELAAARLAARLAVCCTECSAPGWGIVEYRRGARCRLCGTATPTITEHRYGCACCGADRLVALAGADRADPSRCPRCNP